MRGPSTRPATGRSAPGRIRLLTVTLVFALTAVAGTARAASEGAALWFGTTAAPWVESTVVVDVRLGLAHGTVTQRFRNPTARAAEAVYVFPLPTGAAISAMRITVDGRPIDATVAPRPTAQAAYEAAVADGRAAALIERERPGVYTQSIAAVPAGGEVAITLEWRARLDRTGGEWQLAHPMVVGPRFVPGAATGAPTRGGGTAVDTDRAPDASRVTPPTQAGAATPFSFTLHLDDAVQIESPTHTLDLADAAGGAAAGRVVRVADPRGNRELVVRWRGAASAGVRALAEPSGAGAYVAVLIEGAPEAPRPRRTPRSWLVAIDRSASLDGVGAAQARLVAHGLIGVLRDDDQVAVVAIGESPRFVRATAAARARALVQVDRLGKGTGDLTVGLGKTLAGLPRSPATSVVLLTDGLVADDTAAIARAAAAGVVVHAVGVGAAPNRWLLEAIAARSGGTAHVVAGADDAAALAEALAGAEPPLPVTVDWRKPSVIDAEPARPLLVAGGATLIVAFDPKGVPTGEVEVAIGARRLRATIAPVTGAALATEWARQRVGRLWAAGDHDGATALAVARGIVSPTTALVAVGTRAGEPVRSTVTVPLPLPAGVRREARNRGGGDVDDLAADAAPTGGATGEATGTTSVATDRGGGAVATDGADGDGAEAEAAAPEPTRGVDASDERYAEVLHTSGAATRSVLGRAIGRRFVTAGLTLGVRVDEPTVGVGLALGVGQRVTPRTAIGLRLELGAAPAADEPVVGALTVDVTRYGLRMLALELGAGLAWSGDLGLAYRLGLGTTRGALWFGLRLSGAVTPAATPATVGLGVDASF